MDIYGAGASNAPYNPDLDPDESRARLVLGPGDDPDEGQGQIIPARPGPPRGGYNTPARAMGGAVSSGEGYGFGLIALIALAVFAFGRR
jgi:hypothetical protein